MIATLYQNPVVVFQSTDDMCSVPESAIAVSHDAEGLLILNQEGREILIDTASVGDLIKALKSVKRGAVLLKGGAV